MTQPQTYLPEAWAREADRYQEIADQRRAKERRRRRVTAGAEWLTILLFTAGLFALLAVKF